MTRRRVIEYLRVVEEFDDDEPPSLSAIPTTGEEITEVARPGLAKASSERFPWTRKVGGE